MLAAILSLRLRTWRDRPVAALGCRLAAGPEGLPEVLTLPNFGGFVRFSLELPRIQIGMKTRTSLQRAVRAAMMSRTSRGLVAAGSVLVLIFALDALIGYQESLRAFYIVPIWVGVRVAGLTCGAVMVGLTTIVLTHMTLMTRELPSAELFGNFILRLGSLTGIMFFIWKVETGLRHAVRQALHDPLTGVLNRRAANQFANYAIERANRHREPLTVAAVDCDGFKRLNDMHGHAFGDSILKYLARELEYGTRPDGVVARAGGDEFIVILRNRDGEDAARLMESILPNFVQATRDLGVPTTFSYGIAELGVRRQTLEHLVDAADRDMYAKRRTKSVPDKAVVDIGEVIARGRQPAGNSGASNLTRGDDFLHFAASRRQTDPPMTTEIRSPHSLPTRPAS